MVFKSLLRPQNALLFIIVLCLVFLYFLSFHENLKRDYDFFNKPKCSSIAYNSSSTTSTTTTTESSIFLIAPPSISTGLTNSNLNDLIRVFNLIGKNDSISSGGKHFTTYLMFEELLKTNNINLEESDKNSTLLLSRLKNKYDAIQVYLADKNSLELQMIDLAKLSPSISNASQGQSQSHQKEKTFKSKTIQINLAAVACGKRRTEALVMLKSAVLFSQDAALHIIMFSDKATILNVAADLLELKWTVNALGRDITFELLLDWFPHDRINEWKQMYTPCATQRLFFPSLLPHIDSLIYLDTDIIVLSNLTEFWLHFSREMRDTKMAGMAANNEPTAVGWYNTMSKIPYYEPRGLNAGVMLMNLTQMRNFSLEEKSMAALTVYKEKIKLADQDILNIIFHAFPEKLSVLDCSYNFNWVHCGIPKYYPCINKTTGESICFCNATFSNGVKVVHGNGGTFHSKTYFPFLNQLYEDFRHFDFLQDSPLELITNLKTQFNKLANRPCHPLTSHILYDSAFNYFQNVGVENF